MNKTVFKKQTFIVIAVIALMLVMFYLFGWKPQATRLEELAKKKVEQEQRLQAAKNTLVMLEEVKRNAANAEIELIKLSNKMPPNPELPSLIVEIQNIANDAGIDLISLSPGEPSVAGEYSEMKISASVAGSYVALIDFLRRLEKAPRAFKVEMLNIRTKEYPDLDMSATISAFTIEEVGSVPPPPPAQSASVAR